VPESPDLDELLATLRARVEQRRHDGVYPPGLEEELDRHFAHLAGDLRPLNTSFLLDELDAARNDLAHFEFARDRISTESQLPGGTAMHRAVAKATSRQIQGVIEQAQDYARKVGLTIGLMAEVTTAISDAYDRTVIQQLDDLQLRLAEEHRALHGLLLRLDDLAARVPGAPVDAWYSYEAFNVHFRGDADEIMARYRDLAARLVGCAPVLDIGFGRGEFLELLRELDVDAMGIEVDQGMVDAARNRGLRAEVGRAFEYLSALDDASLGGLVMIQVIEHLAPQQAVDVVRLAAEKVRPGGKVIIETVNPTSLITYANAFWMDPDHVRPVHPNFLRFLFGEAGFAHVEVLDRSPVAPDESLELLPGDDELTKRLNANFERINALVFGPQDYAIVATR
jgi:2-polyprenyl-3-methyl-5-hydroxy-6-metoxy-1,4-benzoquinol methylase